MCIDRHFESGGQAFTPKELFCRACGSHAKTGKFCFGDAAVTNSNLCNKKQNTSPLYEVIFK
jgi:hypothetical protein